MPPAGVPEAEAFALGLEDVTAVREAVECGSGEPFAAEHLGPLLEGEDYPQYARGLPRYVRLAGHRVPPRLSKAFKID